MVLRLLALGLTVVLLLLSGCANNRAYQGYSIADATDSTVVAPYMGLRTALTKTSTDGIVAATCFGVPSAADADMCMQQRNEAIAALVIGSETACLAHRRSIYGNDASANITLGTAAALFAGWASVLTNTHPYRSSILSALSLFSTGERALVNETVYKTMIVTAVDQKILELRASKAQVLKANLNQPIKAYSMNQALADWIDFHNSCSFMTGLQLALAEGTQGSNAQKMLRLQANLNSTTVQYKTQSCSPNSTDPSCLALIGQINALGDALKSLAVQ